MSAARITEIESRGSKSGRSVAVVCRLRPLLTLLVDAAMGVIIAPFATLASLLLLVKSWLLRGDESQVMLSSVWHS